MSKIIIIPSNTVDSIMISYGLRNKGDVIIGCSSIRLNSSIYWYDKYYNVPWVTEPEFAQAVFDIAQLEGVDSVLCTHMGIYRALIHSLSEKSININFENRNELSEYEIRGGFIRERSLEHYKFLNLKEDDFSFVEFESLYSYFIQIPGCCSEEKFSYLVHAGKNCPQGDFIEIGSFYGKSALVLGWLAKFKNNNILCIDPWESNEIPQKEAHDAINLICNQLPVNIKNMFVSNVLLPLKGCINYLKSYSDEAFEVYCDNAKIESVEFGEIPYKGKISILHIDGNHDYRYVSSDIENWSKLLLPGAWLIVDDYNWCYGDGPTRAADEFLHKNKDRIENCFYSGGAIFIQMKY